MSSDSGGGSPFRQIDRLVIKELLGPWLFGVGMFASLLMAATYLNRIAEYIVQGLDPSLILKITLLLMPAILAKTFAMAVLLAALLAFGRLSSDSEITALRAAGASIPRIVLPVMAFSLVIAVATFFFNNQVVPPAAAQSQALFTSLENRKGGRAGDQVSFPINDHDHLQAHVNAQQFDILNGKLYGVTVVAYDDNKKNSFFLTCPEMDFNATTKDWHIRGGGVIQPAGGGTVIRVDEAWPKSIAKVNVTPADIITINNHDMDIYSMSEILHEIDRGRRQGGLSPEVIHNLEYAYWNKISIALAAFVFGTLGAVLGIRSQRTGTASGFALAVAIIFGYFSLANLLNVWAINGVLPAWCASFAPIFIGLICSGVIMWRRNS